MKNTLIISLLIILGTSKIVNAQTISLTTGSYSYFGDLEKSKKIKFGTLSQFGFGVALGKKFGSSVEIKLAAEKFSLVQNEVKILNNLNFETKITQFSIAAHYHLANDKIINASSKIQPYVGVGFGMINYETFHDLTDNNGQKYYYWSDATIRNQEENYENHFTSSRLKRDYNYETSAENKSQAYTIPLILGATLLTGNKISVGVETKYYLTTTDNLDNYEVGGKDAFYYLGASISYHFKGKTLNQINNIDYTGEPFSEIDKLDLDNDGVADVNDLCPGTKKGVPVNKNGCPIDSDNDGVPDYLDKEPNTPDSVEVTPEGITLTPQHYYVNYLMYHGDIFPAADFLKNNFYFIPELLREDIAKMVKVETSNAFFNTDSEEINEFIKEVQISEDGTTIRIYDSGSSPKD